MPSDEPSTRGSVFQYEVVPIMLTRGADQSEAGQQWATLRAGLNERGRMGFRVVAVSDGPEGRAVIMERQVDGDPESRRCRLHRERFPRLPMTSPSPPQRRASTHRRIPANPDAGSRRVLRSSGSR